MNKDAQRMAIAEACGWRGVHLDNFYVAPANMKGIPPPPLPGFQRDVPDYLNDLNAIHEAEAQALNWDEQASCDLFNYRCALHKIMGNDPSLWGFADAGKRAEAMLRALGKWRPGT